MSIALVIVHKTLGGHRWSNTHCVQVGTEDSQAPSDADLLTIGAGVAFTDANTRGTPPDILHAIVGAERIMHNSDVTISDVLVTDGKSNTGANASTVYASQSVGLSGAMPGTIGAGTSLEPGGISLLVHRNVVGFGHKPGRLFFRGALTELMVSVGGPRMIQWEGGGISNTISGAVTAANAMLAPYFYSGAGTTPPVMYVLPLYVTPKQFAANPTLPKVGTLRGAVPVATWVPVGPVLRQVQRGRKRK